MNAAIAIFNRLSGNDAVTALVGSKIFPEYRENKIPAIVFDPKVTGNDDPYVGVGPTHYEWTISAIASTYTEACAIADAVNVKGLFRLAQWVDTAAKANVMYSGLIDRDEKEMRLGGMTREVWVIDLIYEATVLPTA